MTTTTTSLDETTSALIAEARSGDRGAFSDLLSRYEARILSAARRGLGRTVRETVESRDILQEVLAETVERFPVCEFRHDGAFWAWLRKITDSKIRDCARRVALERSRGDSRIRSLPATETPSRNLARRERMARLESALRKLPRRQELAIRLRDIEGLSYEHVARQLGLRTQVSARMLRRRGWVALTRILERTLGHGGGEG